MTARPVVHFEIRGRDTKKLRDFYAALFNIPNGPTIAQIRDPEGNLVGLVQQ